MPTPRGLSQAPTSFIGSWCLDIHRLPLVACQNHYKDARVHYAVLKIRAGSPIRTHRVPPGRWSFDANRSRPYVCAGPLLNPVERRRSDVHEVLTSRSDPSGPNSAPRCSVRLSPRSTPCGSTSFDHRARHLMVNVPHFRSTVAPRRLLEKRRMDTHPWTSAECSLERR